MKNDGDPLVFLETIEECGTTHIVMSPLEFMQRLAALVPRPRLHLIRFHGVLAPNAKLRCEIIPSPPEHATEYATDHAHAQGAPARMSWARLLKRVYDIDIGHCPNCAGTLQIIAAIEDPPVILRILTHLDLPSRAPPHGDSIYSKRLDPQAKTGSANGPTIRLGPHSREPPEGDAINHPALMSALNQLRNSAIFTKHSCG